MKAFTYFVVLAIAAMANAQVSTEVDTLAQVQGIIEDTINSTLNQVIGAIPDPISIDEIPIVLPGGVLSGGLNITDLQVTGIHKIVAETISLNIFSLHLDMIIAIKSLNVNTKYWGDVVLAALVPLYGAGKINVNIENAKLNISGAANLTGGISLKDVKVMLTVEDITFDLHGLLNNEEFSALVTTVLNDNFDRFLNDYSEVISGIISPIVQLVINSILHPAADSGNYKMIQKMNLLLEKYENQIYRV